MYALGELEKRSIPAKPILISRVRKDVHILASAIQLRTRIIFYKKGVFHDMKGTYPTICPNYTHLIWAESLPHPQNCFANLFGYETLEALIEQEFPQINLREHKASLL